MKTLVALQLPFQVFQIKAPMCSQNIKIPRKINYLKLLRIHDTMKSIQAVYHTAGRLFCITIKFAMFNKSTQPQQRQDKNHRYCSCDF